MGLVLALLGACASAGADPEMADAPRTGTETWASQVQVDAHPDEVLLVLHAEGLSPTRPRPWTACWAAGWRPRPARS
jgi:pilus assembly protein CpaD